MHLDQLAGRSAPARRDSRDTRERLVLGVADLVREHGSAPDRLADLAHVAGVSVSTAYRYFSSIDDAVRAYVLRLPEHAAEGFRRADRAGLAPEERLHRWNRAWVRACLEHGGAATRLRSPVGFLHRRAEREPAVAYVCDQVETLLAALTADPLPALVVWNAVSDPREVLDLRQTLHWSTEHIARFVTETTLATL